MAEEQSKTTDVAGNGNLLDLSGEPSEADRPVVRLPSGDFRLRFSDELTIGQLEYLQEIGAKLGEQDGTQKVSSNLLEFLGVIFYDSVPDTDARKLTVRKYRAIVDFFKERPPQTEAEPADTGTASAPDASGSTEASATG